MESSVPKLSVELCKDYYIPVVKFSLDANGGEAFSFDGEFYKPPLKILLLCGESVFLGELHSSSSSLITANSDVKL